jgi:hypothetical protein
MKLILVKNNFGIVKYLNYLWIQISNNIQMKNKSSLIQLFNNFYSNVYKRWRVNKEKAGKDIVGEEYESFRSNYYVSKGFEIGNGENVFDSGVNSDLVVLKDGKIRIIEEDKGSYVDGTFLKRALVDFATIIDKCVEDGIECPYFVLSCPTKMKNFEEIYERTVKLFTPKIKTVLSEKFVYLPLCENGRISQKSYYKTENNNFLLSENLIDKQEKILNEILNDGI